MAGSSIGRQAYEALAEELSAPEPAAEILAGMDPVAVEAAREYARRSHKKWPPEPVVTGWQIVSSTGTARQRRARR